MIRKPIPFDFILEFLHPLELRLKPMFGMQAIYHGEKVLLMLRDSAKKPEANGIWVAIAEGKRKSITEEIPAFRQIDGFEKEDKGSQWLLLSPADDNFERSAMKICELIRRSDPRIGRIPKRTGNKSKKNGQD